MNDTAHTRVQTASPLPPTPRWRRELRLLRRDGLRKYLRVLRSYRRFQRTVRRMERTEPYDWD